jgi:DNA-binding transcriptional MerR regulator
VQDKSPRRVLTVAEVRDEYGIPISTQRLWRAEGRFVPWYRAGTRIVYRRELVERWIEEQEQKEQAIRIATRMGGDEA